MGTVTLLLKFGAAVAAAVVAAGLTVVATECPDDVDGKQEVADVVHGEDAEDDVDDGAGGDESQQLEDGLAEGLAAAHVVEGGDGDEDGGP